MKQVYWSHFKKNFETLTLLEGTAEIPRVLWDIEKQSIYKLFYPRKSFSSSRIWPYSTRFVRHSAKIKRKGILAPEVQNHFKILEHERGKVYAIQYHFRFGTSLRKVEKNQHQNLILLLAAFLAQLHDKGIFFKGLHLDNILLTDTQDFALLDITSVSFSWFSLSLRKRARNIKHLIDYPEDKKIFNYNVKATFIQNYLNAAKFSKHQQEKFLEKVLS